MKYDGQIAMCIAFHTEKRPIIRFDFWGIKDVLLPTEEWPEWTQAKCQDEEAERWSVYAIMQDGDIEAQMWAADLDSREAAKTMCDLLNDIKRDLQQSSLMSAFMTTNWAMLKEQKRQLLEAISTLEESPHSTPEQQIALEGVVAMIDGIQDAAIEDGLTTEEETLLMEPEDQDGLKPSDFNTHPWGSVKQKSEAETIARNIMVILARTGNKWRPLTWEEYRTERLKDKDFSDFEKRYFDEVVPFCANPDIAKQFSPAWRGQKVN